MFGTICTVLLVYNPLYLCRYILILFELRVQISFYTLYILASRYLIIMWIELNNSMFIVYCCYIIPPREQWSLLDGVEFKLSNYGDKHPLLVLKIVFGSVLICKMISATNTDYLIHSVSSE